MLVLPLEEDLSRLVFAGVLVEFFLNRGNPEFEQGQPATRTRPVVRILGIPSQRLFLVAGDADRMMLRASEDARLRVVNEPLQGPAFVAGLAVIGPSVELFRIRLAWHLGRHLARL